jgi:hypothetical protein
MAAGQWGLAMVQQVKRQIAEGKEKRELREQYKREIVCEGKLQSSIMSVLQ